MRVIVDLSREQFESLDNVCKAAGISRAEAVRCAVEQYLLLNPPAKEEEAFGIWKKRGIDSLHYQEKLRTEWGE